MVALRKVHDEVHHPRIRAPVDTAYRIAQSSESEMLMQFWFEPMNYPCEIFNETKNRH